MKLPTQALLTLALGAAASLPAMAGRPLQTEDAGVLDRGACEVEGYSARQSVLDSSMREHSLQLSCGVLAATQLAAAVSRSSEDGASANHFTLGGKTRLWKGQAAKDDEAPAFTLAYAVSADKSGGENWRHSATELNLVYSRPLASELTLHANLGYARDELAKTHATTWGLALEHEGFGGFAPMAELYGEGHEAPWWNLGLRWTAVHEKLFLDMSFGQQLATHTPRLVTLGFKFSF